MPPKTAAKKGGKSAKPKVAPPKPPAPERIGKKEIERTGKQLKIFLDDPENADWPVKAPDTYIKQLKSAEKYILSFPYLLPNVVYRINANEEETKQYFNLLRDHGVTFDAFILLLNSLRWNSPPEESFEKTRAIYLQSLIQQYAETIPDAAQTEIKTRYTFQLYNIEGPDQFECDALDILKNFGNYIIIKTEPVLDQAKINLINQVDDVDFRTAEGETYPDLFEKYKFLRPIIKETATKGKGLFAMREYRPGEYVALYEGAHVPKAEIKEPQYLADLTCENDDEKDKDKNFLDGRYNWSLKARGRWMNHTIAKGANNCEFLVIEEAEGDAVEDRTLVLIAIRHIQIGDELLVDYGEPYPYEKSGMPSDWKKNIPALFEEIPEKLAELERPEAESNLAKAAETEPTKWAKAPGEPDKGISLYFDPDPNKAAYVVFDPFPFPPPNK